ncbi:MAG: hypothetical protein AAGA50_29650 [Pseudomonadota bacterium]
MDSKSLRAVFFLSLTSRLMAGTERRSRASLKNVLGTLLFFALFIGEEATLASAQSLSTNPANFRGMTCQQLWYVEQEVLAEGRVCLKTERARRAFSRAERCISADESILPRKARDFLSQLRQVARDKGCSGF